MADQFRQWRQEAEARRVSHATNLSNQISERAVDEFNFQSSKVCTNLISNLRIWHWIFCQRSLHLLARHSNASETKWKLAFSEKSSWKMDYQEGALHGPFKIFICQNYFYRNIRFPGALLIRLFPYWESTWLATSIDGLILCEVCLTFDILMSQRGSFMHLYWDPGGIWK